MNTQNTSPENEEKKEIESVNDDTLGNSELGSDNNDYDSDMERYEQASAASEPSFTLEVEKGLTPDPDSLNKEEEREGNNIKK
jgi:hypothetical protein